MDIQKLDKYEQINLAIYLTKLFPKETEALTAVFEKRWQKIYGLVSVHSAKCANQILNKEGKGMLTRTLDKPRAAVKVELVGGRGKKEGI